MPRDLESQSPVAAFLNDPQGKLPPAAFGVDWRAVQQTALNGP